MIEPKVATPEQLAAVRIALERPVTDSRIHFIKSLLSDPAVSEAWAKYSRLPQYIAGHDNMKKLFARQEAWKQYVMSRESYLKLK